MKREVNSMTFLPEEVEKGMVTDMVKYLIHANKVSNHHFNDIHIWSDSYCTIVEWIWKDYADDLQYGSFKYVGYEQEVCDVYGPVESENETDGHDTTRCEGCQHWDPKDEYCYILDTNMNRTDFCSRAEPKDI